MYMIVIDNVIFNGSNFLAPHLLKTGGHIVNIGSLASKSAAPWTGAYGATKAAQIALARSWQSESAKTGPTVKILTPEPMPTATRARFYPGEDRSVLTEPNAEAARLLPLILS